MDAVKICIFLFFVISDVISFHAIDQLPVLPMSKKSHRKYKNQIHLEQSDVYNGVKNVLRQLFPEDGMRAEADGDGDQDDDKAEDCNDCEPNQPAKSSETPNNPSKSLETPNKPAKSKSNRNGKGSKYTNVNFVLYNSGIKFHKADDAVNKQQLAKLKFNCILVVASANKCYGWDSNKKNGTKNGSADGVNAVDGMAMFEKNIIPAIMPFLSGQIGNSTGGDGMKLNDFIYPPPDGDSNLSPTFRRTEFKDIMDEMHEPSNQVTIFI